MRWVPGALLIALALASGGPASAETTGGPSTATTGGARAPHPEPRVIIDATAKRPADASAVQAAARRGFWGKAVGCYEPALAADPKLTVDASFEVHVRGAIVQRASLRKRGGKRGAGKRGKAGGPTRDREVADCIAKRLVGLAMPAEVRADALVRVRLAPGDPR